jgi:hypothetical protein
MALEAGKDRVRSFVSPRPLCTPCFFFRSLTRRAQGTQRMPQAWHVSAHLRVPAARVRSPSFLPGLHGSSSQVDRPKTSTEGHLLPDLNPRRTRPPQVRAIHCDIAAVCLPECCNPALLQQGRSSTPRKHCSGWSAQDLPQTHSSLRVPCALRVYSPVRVIAHIASA